LDRAAAKGCRRANLTAFAARAYPLWVSEASDKRSHVRTPIELKVEYKKLNTFFADYTKNISKGGTFIKTDRPLPVGTEFIFKLSLPKRSAPFELRGQVIWINHDGEIQRPDVQEKGMGIRFIFKNDSERDGFEKEVEALMVASLGAHLYDKLITKRK
jgi:type IV pilus assembly protein PilZ